jgi:hypothetical protein
MGKYNEFALFVFKTHGMIVSRKTKHSELIVPPGATAHKNDQYSSHPGVIEYMSFTTTVDGMLGELSQQLDLCGYTQRLQAQRDIKTHMAKGFDDILLENIPVKPKPKLVVPPSASGKSKSGEKDDDQWDKDDDQKEDRNDQWKHNEKLTDWDEWAPGNNGNWAPAAASTSLARVSAYPSQSRHPFLATAPSSKLRDWEELSPLSDELQEC